MGLFKRDQVWWMRFSYNGKQIRQSTGATDKKLAEKIHAKVLTQITEGKWFDVDEGKKRTFLELAEKYEATEFKELKSWQSVKSYLNGLKAFFGPYMLSEINPAVIDEFKQKRKTEGVKSATIVRQLNILKRMFNLAKKRWMWIKEVPPIEMVARADKKRLRYLSFEDYHKLLNVCEGWLKGVVTIAAWTGLRQGNILNLKRNQVNLFARTIKVDASDTKNGEHLIIPIAEPAFLVLKEALKVTHIKSQYALCKPEGTPYYKMEVHRAFKEALEKAGIEDFRFHDLRHCFASWNRQAGVDLDTLADLMGHKDTRMTRRYAHIGPVHLASAVGLLEKSYKAFSTNLAQSNEKGLQQMP
ncbi:MAG: site-specific integrase [Deltaproteobacteria bacterium]|nr:site-specific integrase [Deltaproteobacteria bacterium]